MMSVGFKWWGTHLAQELRAVKESLTMARSTEVRRSSLRPAQFLERASKIDLASKACTPGNGFCSSQELRRTETKGPTL
eukprot:8933286-Pyramimonas_sp.AAC.1